MAPPSYDSRRPITERGTSELTSAENIRSGNEAGEHLSESEGEEGADHVTVESPNEKKVKDPKKKNSIKSKLRGLYKGSSNKNKQDANSNRKTSSPSAIKQPTSSSHFGFSPPGGADGNNQSNTATSKRVIPIYRNHVQK